VRRTSSADHAQEPAPANDAPPVPAAVVLRGVTRDFDVEHGARASIKHTVLRTGKGRAEHYRALTGVNLDIPSGSTYALVGHNGSGKSTMLKLIAGIFPPTFGEVEVRGRVTALLELGAGFHPELSGRENVYLAGSIAGRTRAQIGNDVEAIKSFSGLEDFFEAPVKVYSSGMFVRLGFAVAVHLDPEILIVDEVVAVGDEQFQRLCFDHLRSLRERGVTIIFVTHSMGLVEQLADHAAWLDHGVVKKVGSAQEVVSAYLAAVNQAERRAQGPPAEEQDNSVSGSAAAQEGRRRGSGEAVVTGLEFLGAEGTAAEVVAYGEDLTVRLRYLARQPIANPTFGLAVHSEQGWPIAGPNTRLSSYSTGTIEGAGYIDFRLGPCPFVPGVLRFSAAITDDTTTHVFDWLDREFQLKVLPGSGVQPTGMLAVPGEWSGPHLLP